MICGFSVNNYLSDTELSGVCFQLATKENASETQAKGSLTLQETIEFGDETADFD